jgi:hypothetical protein
LWNFYDLQKDPKEDHNVNNDEGVCLYYKADEIGNNEIARRSGRYG